MIVALTDDHRALLEQFAAPVPPPLRDAFLQAVLRRLASAECVTNFLFKAVCAAAQREVMHHYD